MSVEKLEKFKAEFSHLPPHILLAVTRNPGAQPEARQAAAEMLNGNGAKAEVFELPVEKFQKVDKVEDPAVTDGVRNMKVEGVEEDVPADALPPEVEGVADLHPELNGEEPEEKQGEGLPPEVDGVRGLLRKPAQEKSTDGETISPEIEGVKALHPELKEVDL